MAFFTFLQKFYFLYCILIMENKTILLFTDASCWPNPNGDIGIGIVAFEALNFSAEHKNTVNIKSKYDKLTQIHSYTEKIIFGSYGYGQTSNNMGEHVAITRAIMLIHNSKDKDFIVFSDSQMAVKQMTGEYKIDHRKMYAKPALENVELLKDIKVQGKNVEFIWIPRELNATADALSKFN